jgi:D-glycero-D-manno-heptose 1,7-bisphosphate phosphatase
MKSQSERTGKARKRPAVFFDRDGTLMEDRDYLSDPKGARLLPGAARAVRLLKNAGWRVFVVSNQSGVARGLFGERDVRRVMSAFKRLLAARGARLDGCFYCPHHPKGEVAKYRKRCDCRKPAPGMVRQAAGRFPLDLASSFVVGDKADDARLAPRAGLGGALLVLTGYGRKSRRDLKSGDRVVIVPDALAAAKHILRVGGHSAPSSKKAVPSP